MTRDEWEALCDGCGRCCLTKLEDIDTGLYYYTDVACKLLDIETCRCKNYSERLQLVPDCMQMSPDGKSQFNWLPASCAYRRLSEGKQLDWWHPLLSGSKHTVHEAGISVRHRVTSESKDQQDELEDHIIDWIEL
jgi:uncharacterized cysteine cluster protein YcgN (CxxCxxCC family)